MELPSTGGDGDEPYRHPRSGAAAAGADRPQDRVPAPHAHVSHGHHGYPLAEDEPFAWYRSQGHRREDAECLGSGVQGQ